MANIPPHYSDHFITQRYNKALHFVQNLPATSNFQPTKNQKLELYALYKQVSVGDVNTQRPGLFDVVGRAKWDAWKKLEGLSVLQARYMYVESLLRIAAEAYKKNIGREEAQKIIHAFAIMKPSGEETSDDLLSTDETSNQEDEDTSVASEDTEEQAYLRDIEESKITPFAAPNNSTPYGSPDRQSLQRGAQLQSTVSTRSLQQQDRPGSVVSVQSMVTAPTTPRQMPTTRPPSVTNTVSSGALSRLGYRTGEKRPVLGHMTRDSVLPNKNVYNDDIDDAVNPWQHIPTSQHRRSQAIDSGESSNEESIDENQYSSSRSRTPVAADNRMLRKKTSASNLPMNQKQRLGHLSSPSPPLYPQHAIPLMTPIHQRFQSPILDSSASSSVTATPFNNDPRVTIDSRSNNRNRTPIDSQHLQQYTTTVALGPATKRALESLQNEVIALNDRIDDLRRELVERDKQRSFKKTNENQDDTSSEDVGDNWKWVIKAALKYAGINLMTVLVLFLILYKNGSPVAFAITRQASKLWQSLRLRVQISNVVV